MLHPLLHPLRSPSWTVLPQRLLPLAPQVLVRRLQLALPRLVLLRLVRLQLVLLRLVCPEGQQLWAEQEEEMLEHWAPLELEVEPAAIDWNVRKGLEERHKFNERNTAAS